MGGTGTSTCSGGTALAEHAPAPARAPPFADPLACIRAVRWRTSLPFVVQVAERKRQEAEARAKEDAELKRRSATQIQIVFGEMCRIIAGEWASRRWGLPGVLLRAVRLRSCWCRCCQ